MKKKLSRDEQIVWDCYRELYANAEPKADFDELVKNAELNEFGQRIIPFDDYEIDQETFKEILKKYKKRFKYKHRKDAFMATICLGCSPKFK